MKDAYRDGFDYGCVWSYNDFISNQPMTNKEQLHQNFLKDFKELLEKYDAIFQVSDIIDGCVPSIVFPSYYDYENDRLAREYSILEIPNYINSHQ